MDAPHAKFFVWEAIETDCPRVVAKVDVARQYIFGFAASQSSNTRIAFLGTPGQSGFPFNGQVVEIEVLESNPLFDNLLNAVVKQPALDDPPWTVAQFLKWFPDRAPHISAEVLETRLAAIAELPQYQLDNIPQFDAFFDSFDVCG
jgi:hypothetical protein